MVSTPPTKPRSKRWMPKVGDHVEYFGDLRGTITEIDVNDAEPYLVSFDAGKVERFSKADFKKWIERIEEPAPVIDDCSLEKSPKYKIGDRVVNPGGKDGYIQRVVSYRGSDTCYDILWWNGRGESYTEAQIEEYGYEVQTLATEEELTPRDEGAIGKHYWFDQNTVAVEVLSCQYWKKNKGKPIAIGRVRPWWTHEQGERAHPDQFAVEFSHLVEIEEFSCPVDFPREPTVVTNLPVVVTNTGSLYQYTANKADKSGTIHTYPKVEGERKRDEDSQWYWGFSYVEKSLGKWRDKSASVPRGKLVAVRQAIRDRKPYTYILQSILGKD